MIAAAGAVVAALPKLGGVVSNIGSMFGPHPDPNSASQIMSRMAGAAQDIAAGGSAAADAARNDFVAHLIGAYRQPNGWWIDSATGVHIGPAESLTKVHDILTKGYTGTFTPTSDQLVRLGKLAVQAGAATETSYTVAQSLPVNASAPSATGSYLSGQAAAAVAAIDQAAANAAGVVAGGVQGAQQGATLAVARQTVTQSKWTYLAAGIIGVLVLVKVFGRNAK